MECYLKVEVQACCVFEGIFYKTYMYLCISTLSSKWEPLYFSKVTRKTDLERNVWFFSFRLQTEKNHCIQGFPCRRLPTHTPFSIRCFYLTWQSMFSWVLCKFIHMESIHNNSFLLYTNFDIKGFKHDICIGSLKNICALGRPLKNT